MSKENHGIKIAVETIDSESILLLKVTGKLTHHDYEEIIPALESSLKEVNSEHIKILVDITEFSGWEPQAVWDDFKLGLKIGFNIDKVAIYGEKKWQKLAAKIGNWFISGEIKNFADYQSSIKWLVD